MRPGVVALAIVALLASMVRPIGPCLMGHADAPSASNAHVHAGHQADAPSDESTSDGVPTDDDRCPDVAGCTVVALASLSLDRGVDRLPPAPPATHEPAVRPAPTLSIEPPPPRA